MAISGDKQRRSLTLPDMTWAELDAEAEEGKLNISEVVHRYITAGRLTEDEQMEKFERRLDQLTDEVRHGLKAIVEVLEGWKAQQGITVAAPEDPSPDRLDQQRQVLQDWYASNHREEVARPAVVIPYASLMTRLFRWAIYARRA